MKKDLALAALLTMPVLLFFMAYFFNHDAGLIPTGFIQYDNVSYLAYARQYLDHDVFRLQYSNPFNDGNTYDGIYFQPQTLFFALLLKLGVPAMLILPLFTIACSFICFLLLIKIYNHLVPDQRNRNVILLLFAWGGGLLVLAGIVYHFLLNASAPLMNDLFTIDPEGGWWGLNFGRSLFFSCEAYYHALFLGTILALLQQKWITAIALLLLLSLSHPFTGIELALMVSGWAVVELLWRKKQVPVWFVIASIAVTIFHAWYYLVWLEQFAAHKSVSQQYSLTWGLRYYRMIPAYLLVGLLAVAAVWKKGVGDFFAIRSNRLFLCWFLGAFLLANHEWFTAPKQPIHFTRGYIWTSLFLLGLPALQQLLQTLRRRNIAWLFLLIALFLLDNFAWIGANAGARASSTGTAYINKDQQRVLQVTDSLASNNTLVVSRNTDLAYLASVFSSAYPLYSHPYTTPFAERKKHLQQSLLNGIMDSSLVNRDILFITGKTDSALIAVLRNYGAVEVFSNDAYALWRKQP